jgi:hypothetical protein
MATGIGTRHCPERFRQSAELADHISLLGENSGDLAAEAAVQFDPNLQHVPTS